MPLGYLRDLRRVLGARAASSPIPQDDNKEPQSNVVALEPFSSGQGPYEQQSLPAKQPLLDQTLEYQGHNVLQAPPPAKPWRPLMLRRWTLLAFAFVFLLLIASLEIILKVSTDRDGFAADTKLYYVWTYGPTAVFTIIAAFWTQVDYRARQMQPWEEMAKTPQPAAKSLLMDYISPNPVVTFFSSLRHCHWPVAAALFGSFLIKALIIVSTGVFILRPVAFPHEVSMDLTERFDYPSAFNATGVDDSAGLMYSGVLLNEIEYLPGTNAEYATELFNTTQPIKEDAYTMTATGQSFTADLSCEKATIDPNVTFYCPPESGCTSLYVIFEARSENCHMSKFPRNNRTFTVTNNGVPFGSWFGAVLPGTCDGDANEPDRNRLVVFTLYKEQNSTLTNSTAVFCKPAFRLQQSTIKIDQDGSLKSVDPGKILEPPGELTPLALSDAVRTTIAQIDNKKIQTELATQYPMYPKHFGFNSIFLNLILRTKETKAVEDFSDSDLLASGAKKIFKTVAAQVAKRYFFSSNFSTPVEPVMGTVQYTQERLFARIPTLRAMESLIVVLVVICLYMALRPIPPTTPQDPASIARLASMISQSHNFILNMSSTGFLSLKSIQSLLSGHYSLAYLKNANPAFKPHFAIESYETNDQRPPPSAGKYWRPMSTSWPARIALLAVPLSIIVVLEITFRASQRDNGLLDVASNKWTEYGSEFVPALVMVLTKLLFSSADFDLRIIDPYVQLKQGYARAKSSVLNKTVYTWKSDAVWDAYRHGRIAVGTSTFSVIIASFLTVAASGLFSTISVPHQRSANVMRMDSFFDPESMSSNLNGTSFNYTTSVGARLVVYDRMSSPPWTSGPYVLPTLSSVNNGSENLNASESVKVDIPVRRGALSCQMVPHEDLTFNFTQWDEGLKKKPDYNNGLTIHWPLLDDNSCTGLKQNDVPIFQKIDIKDGPFGEWINFDPKFVNYESPCPTSYGVYGNWKGRRPREVNVVLCWSSIEELQASARFNMPDWKLHSLQVNETSKKNVSSGWSTQLNLGDSVFGGSKGNISTSLDGVFTALVRNSTTNVPDTELLEYAKFDKMYARIQAVYSRAAAQITNREGRFTNLTTTSTVLPATVTSTSTSRLRQNLVSTRILQSLLIATLVCALISLLTINPKNVLPKNPCSIAAQASLVAGSLMMAEMPAEAQWMSDEEFDALFDGGRYALGWSEDRAGQGRFGVDVDLRPKEEKGSRWLKWGRTKE